MNETALHRYDTQGALRHSVGAALNDLTVSDANGLQRVFELSLSNGKARPAPASAPVVTAPVITSASNAPAPAGRDAARAGSEGPDAVLALAIALAPPPSPSAADSIPSSLSDAFANRAADAHDGS